MASPTPPSADSSKDSPRPEDAPRPKDPPKPEAPPKPAAKPAPKAKAPAPAAPPPAPEIEATGKPLRHRMLQFSFVLCVVVPTALACAYLWLVAADQYHSKAAFSVRSEEFSNPLEALGAFTQIGSSSASDAEILYDFIRSQPLVTQIDETLDLRALYRRHPEDWVFSLSGNASIEDLMAHWDRMVSVSIDSSSGVLTLEVHAFSPEDARQIAQTIIDRSGSLVDELSRIARQDSMRFAREDVSLAEERLRDIRRRVRIFRSENEMIDPTEFADAQVGVLAVLQEQLADALVSRDSVIRFAGKDDQRVLNLDRRIEAIRGQIEAERQRIGEKTGGPASLVETIGEYEELLVDLEFAQNAYQSALAADEQARAEARRKSRYVGVHIPPTLAEESLYPQRGVLAILVGLCALAAWSTAALIYYNIRERA